MKSHFIFSPEQEKKLQIFFSQKGTEIKRHVYNQMINFDNKKFWQNKFITVHINYDYLIVRGSPRVPLGYFTRGFPNSRPKNLGTQKYRLATSPCIILLLFNITFKLKSILFIWYYNRFCK